MRDDNISMEKATRRFINSLAVASAKSKRDFKHIAHVNFAGVVKNLFGLTPPMWGSFIRAGDGVHEKQGGGVQVDFNAGKRASDRTIEKDINRATWNIKEAGKSKGRDVPSQGMSVVTAYLACRNARKRYAGGFPRKPISEGDQWRIRASLWQRQGWTPGHWMAAAKWFLVRDIPEWITRWSDRAEGNGGTEPYGQNGFRMFAISYSKHVNANKIQRAVSIAIYMQVKVMERDFGFWAKNLFGKTFSS